MPGLRLVRDRRARGRLERRSDGSGRRLRNPWHYFTPDGTSLGDAPEATTTPDAAKKAVEALALAALEGRNVLPDATDDQASTIEQWAITVEIEIKA